MSLELFFVVSLVPGSIRNPFGLSNLHFSVSSQRNHFIELVDQAVVVGADLSDDFISIQTEDKLGFGFDGVMPGDFAGNVAVDFDDLE